MRYNLALTPLKFVAHPDKGIVVTHLRQWAASHPEIARIIIYGSRARGDHRSDSDFDVAVELDKSRWDESPFVIWTASARAWRRELAPNIPWPLDLQWHDKDGETPTVAAGIESGPLVVYER